MNFILRLFFILFCLPVFGQNFPIPAHQDDDVTKKMGYVDPQTKKWVIPAIYDYCRPFGPQGTAVVFQNRKAGFIDQTGMMIIQPTYDDAQNFNAEGVAIVRKVGRTDNYDGHDPTNDRFAAIDTNGKLILPFVFRELNDKSFPGTFIGRQEARYGIVARNGKTLLPFDYHMINVHGSREVAILRRDSLLGVITNGYNMVVPMGDNMARFAGSRRISLFNEGKFGYCDFNGQLVVNYEYEQFAIFREGLCVIKKNGYFGYIDTMGNTIIPFVYDGGEPFVNDTAIVLKQGKMGMINTKNETLVEFVYDRISRYFFPQPPGGILLIKREEWFCIDPNSGEIVPWDYLDMNDPNLNKPEPEEKK